MELCIRRVWDVYRENLKVCRESIDCKKGVWTVYKESMDCV